MNRFGVLLVLLALGFTIFGGWTPGTWTPFLVGLVALIGFAMTLTGETA